MELKVGKKITSEITKNQAENVLSCTIYKSYRNYKKKRERKRKEKERKSLVSMRQQRAASSKEELADKGHRGSNGVSCIKSRTIPPSAGETPKLYPLR